MQTQRNKSKYKGIKRFIMSFKYSIDGLLYSYKNEKSLGIHAFLTILGVLFGIFFKISLIEWAQVAIVLIVILAAELINTAIEAAVDMVTIETNPLAKIAKDCGSAATFVLSILGAIVAGIIFVPKILVFLGL